MSELLIKKNFAYFFTTYKIIYRFESLEDFITTSNNLIRKVIEEEKIDLKLVYQMKNDYDEKNKEINIEIICYDYDPNEFKKLPEEVQIRTILEKIRYSNGEIKSIEYKNTWENSTKKAWVVDVVDLDYRNALKDCDIESAKQITKLIRKYTDVMLDYELQINFMMS